MSAVLLIAWAGADWRLLRPLIEAGRMPHLHGLMRRGVHGNLRSLQPQSPALLWTSMITGKRASEHGILGPLVALDEDAGVAPASALDRRVPALWEMLQASGRRADVVGWPYSHPVGAGDEVTGRIQGTLISELFGWARGDRDDPAPPPAGTIWPPEAAAALADLTLHPLELGADLLEWLVPGLSALTAEEEELVAELALAVARCASIHGAATALLETGPRDLLAVCYDPLELLSPRFLALYPPRLPYVPRHLLDHFQHVLPRVYELLDMQLGRLLDLCGPETRVVLVSDHGYHSDHLRPQTAELASQALGAPWIREQGVLVMAGPGIRADGEHIEGAGLLDLVPTLLTLLGLPPGRDMPGRVLWQALATSRGATRIGSWMPAARSGACALTPDAAELLLATRILLGEIPTTLPTPDPATGLIRDPATAAAAARAARLNLALSHLDGRRPDLARPLLEDLHRTAPDDERIKLHLSRALHATGDLQAARDLMTGVAEAGPPRPREHLMLSRMHLAEGDPTQALVNLFRAEQASPGEPALHCRIGEVYLQLGRWDDAARAFGKALALDTDSALAHHGMAIVHLAQERPEQAVESALTAVGLNQASPQAHYHLGLALTRLGRGGEAITAFETCLSLNETNVSAHQWLARLYEPSDPAQARWHGARAAHLRVAELLR